nr:DUF2064 domain-containing protein [Lewinella sp. JB7]
MPVHRYDESRQRGRSFGERLANAAAEVFARGIDQLIIVGNDCPTLRADDLRRAAGLLSRGDGVLGADRRGGAWLIGLHRRQFDPDRFAGLPWQSRNLRDELVKLFPGVCHLRELRDVNGLRDLHDQWVRLRSLLPELAFLLIDYVGVFGDPAPGRTDRTRLPVVGRAPPTAA